MNSGSKQVGQTFHLAANFTNPDGSPGKVIGVPVWATDNPDVVDPNDPATSTITADGLQVACKVKKVGVANITCDGQGDPVVGTDDVQLKCVLTGIEQEISGGSIDVT